MKSGKNVWACLVCNWVGRFPAGSPSDAACSQCNSNDLFPRYPAARVHGATYTPYTGGTRWEQLANSAMADETSANFRNTQAR